MQYLRNDGRITTTPVATFRVEVSLEVTAWKPHSRSSTSAGLCSGLDISPARNLGHIWVRNLDYGYSQLSNSNIHSSLIPSDEVF